MSARACTCDWPHIDALSAVFSLPNDQSLYPLCKHSTIVYHIYIIFGAMRLPENEQNVVIFFFCFSFAENYRLQSAYEKNLIIKMVLVSEQVVFFLNGCICLRGKEAILGH